MLKLQLSMQFNNKLRHGMGASLEGPSCRLFLCRINLLPSVPTEAGTMPLIWKLLLKICLAFLSGSLPSSLRLPPSLRHAKLPQQGHLQSHYLTFPSWNLVTQRVFRCVKNQTHHYPRKYSTQQFTTVHKTTFPHADRAVWRKSKISTENCGEEPTYPATPQTPQACEVLFIWLKIN